MSQKPDPSPSMVAMGILFLGTIIGQPHLIEIIAHVRAADDHN